MALIADFLTKSEDDTHDVGQKIARHLSFPDCVYLRGEMGAGKTTLCKSLIHAFGYTGEVTSPTYNLVQEYPVANGVIYHMDLYRLDDPEELEFLAIDDLWSQSSIFLIEWPQRAGSGLIPATKSISLEHIGSDQRVIRVLDSDSTQF